jgi:uncharacterized protein involved in exopolysaccharide biosynthesis
MDQEIDLRQYIAVLLKYKFWIAGLAVLAAVVAAVVSLMLAPTYEATALVAVTEPQYELQFDARIRSPSDDVQPPYKAYPLLATSDEVVSALIADLGDTLEGKERTIEGLRAMLEAESNGDPSIIRLSVRNGDPGRAALIANQWAERFVQAANELYAQSSGELDFFTEQQTEAESTLAEAEEAMIDFQARNRAAILETQLNDAQEALRTTLKSAHSLETTVQDARALRDRLHAQEINAPALTSDELTALLIELSALNRGDSRLQLQLSTTQDLGEKTVGDQIAFLDSLIVVLEGRLVQLEEQAQALEPEILALQEASQEARTEQDRLSRAHSLARDTFLSLSRKATEARIAAQDKTGEVRLASRATPSDRPVSPRKTLNTLAAGVLGLMVGIVAALAIEYWRSGQQDAPSS